MAVYTASMFLERLVLIVADKVPPLSYGNTDSPIRKHLYCMSGSLSWRKFITYKCFHICMVQ